MRIRLVLVAGVVAALVACGTNGGGPDGGDDPGGAPDGGFEIDVPISPPVKLDVLFVIDDSSSMCQEQKQLSDNVAAFLAGVGQASSDVRVAVTTTDVRTPDFRGAFRTGHATRYGPACQVNRVRECNQDSDCEALEADLGADWTCTWTGKQLNLTINDDGSVNSACHKGCATDPDCTSIFGDSFTCSTQTAGAVGCIESPPVEGCPDATGPVLRGDDADGLRCLVNVGAEGGPNKNLEGGLKAALLALDRGSDPCTSPSANVCALYDAATLDAHRSLCPDRLAGCAAPLADGEPDFLRDDAWLLVVFLTDEDDCSDRDDDPLSLNDTKLCAYNDDKLLPVVEVAASLKALKADPSRVIVAGIVGDAAIGGSQSCLVSDRCLVERNVDACRCYQPGGDRTGCPAALASGTPEALCSGQGLPAADAEAELAYRLTCLDACLGKAEYNSARTCAKLVPDACGCYAHDGDGVAINAATPACQAALADEPAYRVACQRACFRSAKEVSAVQPNTAPHICSSERGIADQGSRYQATIELFGDRGLAANICDHRGVGVVLQDIGARAAELISSGN